MLHRRPFDSTLWRAVIEPLHHGERPHKQHVTVRISQVFFVKPRGFHRHSSDEKDRADGETVEKGHRRQYPLLLNPFLGINLRSQVLCLLPTF
jgi:hypothetical protein